MKYEILDENGNTINTILADDEFVSNHYQYYKSVVEEEHTNNMTVPQTITKLQAKKQMEAIGKWQEFKAILKSNEDINDEWVISNDLNRSYQLVSQVAQLFNFSEEDMDNFFIEASKL